MSDLASASRLCPVANADNLYVDQGSCKHQRMYHRSVDAGLRCGNRMPDQPERVKERRAQRRRVICGVLSQESRPANGPASRSVRNDDAGRNSAPHHARLGTQKKGTSRREARCRSLPDQLTPIGDRECRMRLDAIHTVDTAGPMKFASIMRSLSRQGIEPRDQLAQGRSILLRVTTRIQSTLAREPSDRIEPAIRPGGHPRTPGHGTLPRDRVVPIIHGIATNDAHWRISDGS